MQADSTSLSFEFNSPVDTIDERRTDDTTIELIDQEGRRGGLQTSACARTQENLGALAERRRRPLAADHVRARGCSVPARHRASGGVRRLGAATTIPILF